MSRVYTCDMGRVMQEPRPRIKTKCLGRGSWQF